MVHRKEEYEANGREVTIQQVQQDSDIYAWIDGSAAYLNHAMDKTDELPESIAEKIESDDEWKAVKTLLAWMTFTEQTFCKKCNSFYPMGTGKGTGFAGHICGSCAREKAECEASPDGSHDDECTNPNDRHNARVATRYKCKHCGRVRKTTPTG